MAIAQPSEKRRDVTDKDIHDLAQSGQSAAELIAQRDALAEQVEVLTAAINNCINYANGREQEWGARAQSAFDYLHDAVAPKITQGR